MLWCAPLLQRCRQLGVVVNPGGKHGWCSRMNVHVHGSTKDTLMLEKSLATVENLSRRVRVRCPCSALTHPWSSHRPRVCL